MAVIAVLSPSWCYGQSTLNFPRVVERQNFSTTGFALVNPSPERAGVTFTIYKADGGVMGTSAETVPARGQFSKLASELFPLAAGAGWIQVTSTVTGLQGFWVAGDFSTFADGAEAAPSSTELVLPLISARSEINIVNTGGTDITVLLNLLGTDGFDVSGLPFPQRVPAKGSFKADMTSIFRLDDPNLPSHIRITCPCANGSFAATVIVRDLLSAPSWAAANGVPVASGTTTIYFPHVVDGPQGNANWRSLLGITNLSAIASNSVSITFSTESGEIVRTNQQTIPPNGAIRLAARDLVGPGAGFQSGWMRVTSTNEVPLTGYIAYADLVPSGVAVVPPQGSAETSLLFGHIADLPPWLTGIALLNTNNVPADVDVFAISPDGLLIGRKSFSLGAGTNSAKLLRELIPETQTRKSDGGLVFVWSSLPIFGIELFFSRDQRILANVSAGRILPGIVFVPPLP
jgi:hypothetical protein